MCLSAGLNVYLALLNNHPWLNPMMYYTKNIFVVFCNKLTFGSFTVGIFGEVLVNQYVLHISLVIFLNLPQLWLQIVCMNCRCINVIWREVIYHDGLTLFA